MGDYWILCQCSPVSCGILSEQTVPWGESEGTLCSSYSLPNKLLEPFKPSQESSIWFITSWSIYKPFSFNILTELLLSELKVLNHRRQELDYWVQLLGSTLFSCVHLDTFSHVPNGEGDNNDSCLIQCCEDETQWHSCKCLAYNRYSYIYLFFLYNCPFLLFWFFGPSQSVYLFFSSFPGAL